jgi:hypothetical protein
MNNVKLNFQGPGLIDWKLRPFPSKAVALEQIEFFQREQGQPVTVIEDGQAVTYWWPTSDLSDEGLVKKEGGAPVEEQILAASAKTPPADADIFGYVESADSLLRRFTWANLKAALKGYFDGIYSTFFPTTGGDGTKFLSDAGDYREAGSGGGGHTIKDNEGTALTQRDTLKFSGFLTAVDNETSEETEAGIDPEQMEEYDKVEAFQVPLAAQLLLSNGANWTSKVYTGTTLVGCDGGMFFDDDDYFYFFFSPTRPIRTEKV